ncbi:hypothetical protein PtA15_3A162 [Puccinia triticina]|uniref:Uncharacterized protein n=1 Tax=Puccinia triticina TaxID=208348 RepID=A0ABY7CEJ9_9BASI|nr:uncharacterized protein PtA15_3A162 [Puccinia triticina]WAQ82798.1 hypothetical protein PtA15_3A162 [Puccinia triticina]WAR53639.1 hypothetical protein PtB15_3B147 [Puccinia triticina]
MFSLLNIQQTYALLNAAFEATRLLIDVEWRASWQTARDQAGRYWTCAFRSRSRDCSAVNHQRHFQELRQARPRIWRRAQWGGGTQEEGQRQEELLKMVKTVQETDPLLDELFGPLFLQAQAASAAQAHTGLLHHIEAYL